MPSLRQWLESIGLERDRIDFDVLGELSEQHLEKLGVARGDRKRLLKAIGAIERIAARPCAGEPVVERRQVTVAFIDLPGYTQLTTALGAEAAHALIRRFREAADRIISGHGRVVERHLGDAVMAVFGLPVAHGNDPERALRTVQAIHDAMPVLNGELGQGLRVHAGIASGQVIASRENDGTSFATVGDAVNLAARLVPLAAEHLE
jgi:class 3 adenylate cyclase